MSREFCRDVPVHWGCSKSLRKKVHAHFSFPIKWAKPSKLGDLTVPLTTRPKSRPRSTIPLLTLSLLRGVWPWEVLFTCSWRCSGAVSHCKQRASSASARAPTVRKNSQTQLEDDRQITHLICVRLKHLLYDFLGGVWGLLPVVFLISKAQNTP